MYASTHYIKAYATVGPIPTERIKKLLRLERSSCDIHHRPQVRSNSIELKYPIIT